MSAALSHPDYPASLAALKERILTARLSAARAVNNELVLLYWDIGRGIVEKQRAVGWGVAVVEHLAADLRAEFPDMRGFSAVNIWRMRQFYEYYATDEFLAQAAREFGDGVAQPNKGVILSQAVRELDAARDGILPTDFLFVRLQQFILELGYGFCFVGRQYRLALGQKEYYVDLLF